MEHRKLCDRREFLKKSLVLTSTVIGAPLLGGVYKAFGQEAIPDLVAVKNGEPDVLFDHAIAALGGMKAFVKPNQTVVIKPNIGWAREPETGANTNPLLVKRIIEHCKEAGAKKIYVFDNPVDDRQRCYQKSGIEQTAKEAGAIVVPGDADRYFHKITVPNAKTLKDAKVHELILQSDVYINVPVLKNHFASNLTMAMKNQMGIVQDRDFFHYSGLHKCIAELCLFKKPDLNVLDAYRVTLRNGPQSAGQNDIELRKSLLISKDIVAIDAAGAKMLGVEPKDVNHILLGSEMKIGNMNLDRLNIKKITL
jgi:uncharacterized protein (DUF362 family)